MWKTFRKIKLKLLEKPSSYSNFMKVDSSNFYTSCLRLREVTSGTRRKDGWESVIGLEVHAQISSESKLFSKAGTKFMAPVNSEVSLFDAAIPGTLPSLNKKCVEAAALTAMALSCQINHVSWFDRKHYFYADLPAGYQITQQRKAIANNGELQFLVYNPTVHKKPYYKKSKIRQLQLEQDSGKSLHLPEGNRSLIDLNRAGVALMEIVFEPDINDGEEAAGLVKELCLILESLGTCNCRMEEGSLRVDANISVRRIGEELGVRTEVKNISSTRSIANAIEFEVHRQLHVLEKGGTITNETRSYDAVSKQTLPMRDKEERQDYRFMPEPNLPPLRLSYSPTPCSADVVNIFDLRHRLIELPDVKRKKLSTKYSLKLENTIVLLNTPGFTEYFEKCMDRLTPSYGQKVYNFLSVEMLQLLNNSNSNFINCPVPPENISELIMLMIDETISYNKSKDVLSLMFNGDIRKPHQIVEESGWLQVKDDNIILQTCREICRENPKLVLNYQTKGKPKYFNQLVGKVKAKSEGTFDMKKVTQILAECVKNPESPEK